jgi:hypothetical protein
MGTQKRTEWMSRWKYWKKNVKQEEVRGENDAKDPSPGRLERIGEFIVDHKRQMGLFHTRCKPVFVPKSTKNRDLFYLFFF